VLVNPQESVLFEKAYEALHVKLVIGNLLEYNFNQQISLPKFVPLTEHVKLTLTKIFFMNVKYLFSLLFQFHCNFVCLCVIKNYMMLFFRKWPGAAHLNGLPGCSPKGKKPDNWLQETWW